MTFLTQREPRRPLALDLPMSAPAGRRPDPPSDHTFVQDDPNCCAKAPRPALPLMSRGHQMCPDKKSPIRPPYPISLGEIVRHRVVWFAETAVLTQSMAQPGGRPLACSAF